MIQRICYYCKNIEKCNYCFKYGSIGVYLFLENQKYLKDKLIRKSSPYSSNLKDNKQNNRYKTKGHIKIKI